MMGNSVVTEIWLHGFPAPRGTVTAATQAEAWGYDGMLLADSEILVADPYIELALAARETTTLQLGPGVTNPVTRNPAVTAAALATLNIESGGRAVVVMGRGDSAVLQLGEKPAATPQLESAVIALQDYLTGRRVATTDGHGAAMSWATAFDVRKVPVSVAATGPTTIALGAKHADRVDVTVGADEDAVAAAVTVAKRAAESAGRSISVGAFVNCAVHPDVSVARDLVRGSAAIFAHFVSQSPGAAPANAADRDVVHELGKAYDESRHGLSAAAHAGRLPEQFLDRFTVVGTPEHCTQRLRQLVDVGLDRIIVVPGSRDSDPRLLAASNELLAAEVLPHVRASS